MVKGMGVALLLFIASVAHGGEINLEGFKKVRLFIPYQGIKPLPKKQSSGSFKLDIGISQAEAAAVPNHGRVIELNLDDYLLGVLAGEIPRAWPKEMLKAQAIAARSYTLYQLTMQKNSNFDLRADVLDQVYDPGASVLLANGDLWIAKLKAAIFETANLVLVEKEDFLKAFYHSDCGGQTEEASTVWGGKKISNLKGGKTVSQDATCNLRSKSKKWSYKISSQESDLKILSRWPSGRVKTLVWKKEVLTGEEFRSRIGFDKIKSTNFSVVSHASGLVVQGRGHGHGVGLCQYGARDMALRGKTFAEILEHYYPAAHIYAQNKGSKF
jgi:stage II sporulation protein D